MTDHIFDTVAPPDTVDYQRYLSPLLKDFFGTPPSYALVIATTICAVTQQGKGRVPANCATHPKRCLRNSTHTSSFVRMTATPPMSVAQAAEQHDIPKRTLQAAIARGALKAHKMPGVTGAYLIYQRDLDKWIGKRDSKASA